MKYNKNKKFNIPKFLFIFVGLCSCVCALNVQKTLSYFYTSYGFANTFQTAASSEPSGSVAIYQKCTMPDVWIGQEVTDEVHIANTSDEGGDSRYLRVAFSIAERMENMSSHSIFCARFDDEIFSNWNATYGVKVKKDGKYSFNEEKWIKNGAWCYYKTPLAPQTDIQIYDSTY